MKLLLIACQLLICSVVVPPSKAIEVSLCVVILSQEVEEDRPQTIWSKDVHVIHANQYFSDVEIMAILPLFPKLSSWHGNSDRCNWFMFVTRETDLHNETLLSSTLHQYKDPGTIMYFIGHSLQDVEPTITHHYLFHTNSIQYPLLCSGFVLSKMAINRVASHYEKYLPDFTIDPVYELAIFLKYLRFPRLIELHQGDVPQHNDGITLTDINGCCAELDTDCFTCCSKKQLCTKPPLALTDVVFAVKTCQKFHNTRLPVMWKTWTGKHSPFNIHYFSDVADSDYITVETGVRNTERGHCSKFLAILHQISRSIKTFSWLIVCDDDTLISVSRLLNHIACYDHNEPIIIGEMYGYRAHSNTTSYLYPTGGSGIVFSRRAVDTIVQSGVICPSDEYADDMFIGMISMLRLQIKLVHSPLFHQDQPRSYHQTVLQSSLPPISFHRHSPQDPIDIYNTYLKDNSNLDTSDIKTEL